MSKTDLAVVLCKLVGLYFMINAIHGMGQLVMVIGTPLLLGGANAMLFGSMNSIQLVLNMALPHLVGLLIGLVVWRKAPVIGQKMAA